MALQLTNTVSGGLFFAWKRCYMSDVKFLRLAEVLRKTGLSRSTLYAYISAGQFPRQILLGARCSGWVSTEVDQWISDRINASRSRPVVAQNRVSKRNRSAQVEPVEATR
jgi:prophage regulatory protein